VTIDLRQKFVLGLIQSRMEIRFLVHAILVDITKVKILKRLSGIVLRIIDLALFDQIHVNFAKRRIKAFRNGALISNRILVKPGVA